MGRRAEGQECRGPSGVSMDASHQLAWTGLLWNLWAVQREDVLAGRLCGVVRAGLVLLF